jgi:hypothetical protein
MGSLAYEKVLGRFSEICLAKTRVVVVPIAATAGCAADAEGSTVLPASVGSGWQLAARSKCWPGCCHFCPGHCSGSLCSPYEGFLGKVE